MIAFVIRWWRTRQRDIDLDILWPICKQEAGSLDHARAIFAVHAFKDQAWLVLGEEEIVRRIDRLC